MSNIRYLSTVKNTSAEPEVESPKIQIQGYKRKYTPLVLKQESSEETTAEAEAEAEAETPDYTIGYLFNPPQQEQVRPPLLPESKGKRYTNREEFVRDLTNAYSKELASKGIDTKYAKMLVAQDALESAWGTSSLAEVFNFGGVKAYANTAGVKKDTVEFSPQKRWYQTEAKFRSFDSLEDYANYKVSLLNGSRYNAFTGDPNQFYQRVKAGGYATDPNYVSKLLKMYNSPIFSQRLGGKLPNIK